MVFPPFWAFSGRVCIAKTHLRENSVPNAPFSPHNSFPSRFFSRKRKITPSFRQFPTFAFSLKRRFFDFCTFWAVSGRVCIAKHYLRENSVPNAPFSAHNSSPSRFFSRKRKNNPSFRQFSTFAFSA